MAKYHISPETGNANKCDAKVRCPFGVPLEEHYSSKEEARAAYEKAHGQQALQTLRKGDRRRARRTLSSHATLSPIDPSSSVPLKQQLREAGVKEESKVIARESSSPSLEKWQAMQATADALLKDYYDLPMNDKAWPRGIVDLNEDFRYLGQGTHRVSYLHEPSGMVYKVPRRELESLPPKFVQDLTRYEQESYGILDNDALASQGITYATTYFLDSSEGVPVQVQDYMDEDHYRPAVWLDISDEQWYYLYKVEATEEAPGLSDYHLSNMFTRQKSDKRELVFIDCLAAPNSFWENAREAHDEFWGF